MNKLHAAALAYFERQVEIEKFGEREYQEDLNISDPKFGMSSWAPVSSEICKHCAEVDVIQSAEHMNLNYCLEGKQTTIWQAHCKSFKHVANLKHVDVFELKKIVNEIKEAGGKRLTNITNLDTAVLDFATDYLNAKQKSDDAFNLIKDNFVKREVKSL